MLVQNSRLLEDLNVGKPSGLNFGLLYVSAREEKQREIIIIFTFQLNKCFCNGRKTQTQLVNYHKMHTLFISIQRKVQTCLLIPQQETRSTDINFKQLTTFFIHTFYIHLKNFKWSKTYYTVNTWQTGAAPKNLRKPQGNYNFYDKVIIIIIITIYNAPFI